MRNILSAITLILGLAISMAARESGAGSKESDIEGIYLVSHQGEESKVKISRDEDGTFSAQVIWVKDRLDRNGNVRLDEKNPDKALRNTPCDRIVLITGLEFDTAKQRWHKGKIYDPTRGIKANAMCWFENSTDLKVRGSLMGFSETIIWKKVE